MIKAKSQFKSPRTQLVKPWKVFQASEATLLQRHGSLNRPLSKGHQSTSIFSGSMHFLGSVPHKLLPRRSVANNVEIHIPVPSDVDSPSFKTSIGTVRYIPDQARLGYGFGGLGFRVYDSGFRGLGFRSLGFGVKCASGKLFSRACSPHQ